MSGKNFSEAQMRRYFKGKRSYKNSIYLIVVGILLIGGGVAGNALMLVLIGLVPIALGIIIVIVVHRLQPTDKEYDEWVDRQGTLIEATALQEVHMDKSQLVRAPLHLRGAIIPNSDEAMRRYGNNVDKKLGKDGLYRYSVNVFTYFFPAEHHIAVLSCGVDALDQRAYMQNSKHYFYKDMVGVDTSEVRFEDKGDKLVLILQTFSLLATNGDAVGIPGVVSVKVLDAKKKKSGPKVAFASTPVSETVSALLLLLRQKKQDQQ